jgi:hypothetical protein
MNIKITVLWNLMLKLKKHYSQKHSIYGAFLLVKLQLQHTLNTELAMWQGGSSGSLTRLLDYIS